MADFSSAINERQHINYRERTIYSVVAVLDYDRIYYQIKVVCKKN